MRFILGYYFKMFLIIYGEIMMSGVFIENVQFWIGMEKRCLFEMERYWKFLVVIKLVCKWFQ